MEFARKVLFNRDFRKVAQERFRGIVSERWRSTEKCGELT